MNSFARADDFDTSNSSAKIVVDESTVSSIGSGDWAILKESFTRTTRHGGLSLKWRGDSPVPATRPTNLHLALKRGFDVVSASLLIVGLAPLLVIVALLVKITSRGPVLFNQAREGLDGRSFQALKFRSMTIDHCDHSGVAQTISNDPRLTSIGRFIRRTSIDELPQLFNVVRGDMSLVGPRPHVAGMYAGGKLYRDLVPYYEDRLLMRPGITGWAQANGLRGPTTETAKAIARVDHDLAYIHNFTIWLDVKILVLTVRNEFLTGSGH